MRGFINGILGGIIFVVITIAVFMFCHRHNAVIHPVYIGNIEAVKDSITLPEIQMKLDAIKQLKEQGILLTPQEYTNNVVNYYNTIITFLIALLALFSLVTFFHLKFITSDEVKKNATELLRKSPDVQKIILDNIKGKIDELLFDASERIAILEDEVKKLKKPSQWDNYEDESDIQDEGDLEKLKVKK
jgi:hypothetical protein